MAGLIPVSEVVRRKPSSKKQSNDGYISASSLREIPVNITVQKYDGAVYTVHNMEELNSTIHEIKNDVATLATGVDDVIDKLSNLNSGTVKALHTMSITIDTLMSDIDRYRCDVSSASTDVEIKSMDEKLAGILGEEYGARLHLGDARKKSNKNKGIRTLYFKITKLSHPDSLVGEDSKHIDFLCNLFFEAKSAYSENDGTKLSSIYYEVLIYRLSNGMSSNVPKEFVLHVQSRLEVLGKEMYELTSSPMFQIYKAMDAAENVANVLFKRILSERMVYANNTINNLVEVLQKLKEERNI